MGSERTGMHKRRRWLGNLTCHVQWGPQRHVMQPCRVPCGPLAALASLSMLDLSLSSCVAALGPAQRRPAGAWRLGPRHVFQSTAPTLWSSGTPFLSGRLTWCTWHGPATAPCGGVPRAAITRALTLAQNGTGFAREQYALVQPTNRVPHPDTPSLRDCPVRACRCRCVRR
jgi:hypothetical protein